MFQHYWMIELTTGTRTRVNLPLELPELAAHRMLDSLNQNAAIYGVVYVLREPQEAAKAVLTKGAI